MNPDEKILDLDILHAELDRIREHKRIVHCHGTFDVMHLGHIRHFRKARQLGDVLVVTITPDHFVNKGPHRPIFTAKHRAEVLASLAEVDYVAINRWPTAVETIALLQPHVYVKGSEYRSVENDLTGKIVDEQLAIEAVGGAICFTEDIVFSSSSIVNRCMSPFSEEIQAWLLDFSSRYDTDYLLQALERMRALHVLAIGETIIHERHTCEIMGNPGQKPVLAAQCLNEECRVGGILGIANNLASFAGKVRVLSQVGEIDSRMDLIESSLADNVEHHFLEAPGAPTMVKRCFVERRSSQKLFETYKMGSDAENPAARLPGELEALLPEADVVAAADYGHGLLNQDTVDLLINKSRFLSVKVQINAGNYGYHAFPKYPRASMLTISEAELRMEFKSRTAPLESLVLRAAERTGCRRIIIYGAWALLCWSAQEGFIQAPFFVDKAVDGVGDLAFSMVSLCGALGLPLEVTGFLGSVAGTQTVDSLYDEQTLDKVSYNKNIVSLLK